MVEDGYDLAIEEFSEKFPSLSSDNGSDLDTFLDAIVYAGFRKAKYELKLEINSILKKKNNFNLNDLKIICDSIYSNSRNKKVSLKETRGINTSIRKDEDNQAIHTYYVAEIIGFSDWISKLFSQDDAVKSYLPITQNNFFQSLDNGLILCYMVNATVPNTIDERLINRDKDMSLFKKYENCSLAVTSSEAIGCCVVNVGAQDIIDQNTTIILGLVWQLIKRMLLSNINLIDHPNLFLLTKDTNMTLEDLARMSPEELIILWVNYQLSKSTTSRRLNSFPNDIMDGEIYSHLINQIAPKDVENSFVKKYGTVNLPLTKSRREFWLENARAVLKEAKKIEADVFVKPEDIINGNSKLNYGFLGYLFNNFPNLEDRQEDLPVIEETREEKAIRNWMNSFDLNINYLYYDLRDGLAILKIYDKIKGGTVNWKKVTQKFDENRNKFKKIENCNHVVDLAKTVFNLSTVNISGPDIYNGNRQLTLALIWQVMNYNLLEILVSLSRDSRRPTDSEILSLVNKKLESKVRNFRSNEFSNSKPLFDLLRKMRGDLKGLNHFVDENSEQIKMKNATLILSLIRQCGGKTFVLPEDIVECKPKQIMLVCVSILSLTSS